MPGFKLDLSDVNEIVNKLSKFYKNKQTKRDLSPVRNTRFKTNNPMTKEAIRTKNGYSAYKYFKIIYALNKKSESGHFMEHENIRARLYYVDKYIVEHVNGLFYSSFKELKSQIPRIIDNYFILSFGKPHGNDFNYWVKDRKSFTHPQIKLIINSWDNRLSPAYSVNMHISRYYFLLSVKDIYGDKMPKKLKCSQQEYSLISQYYVLHAENIFNTVDLCEIYKLGAANYIMSSFLA